MTSRWIWFLISRRMASCGSRGGGGSPLMRPVPAKLLCPASGLRVPASGLRAPDSGLRAPGSGLRFPASGLRAPGSGLRAPDSGLRTPGSGLRIHGGRRHVEQQQSIGTQAQELSGQHRLAPLDAQLVQEGAVAGVQVLDPHAVRPHGQQRVALADLRVAQPDLARVAAADRVASGRKLESAGRLARGLDLKVQQGSVPLGKNSGLRIQDSE